MLKCLDGLDDQAGAIDAAPPGADLQRRLGRLESLRTVGKVFTWTGIGATAAGSLLIAVGLAGFYSGLFSLDLGEAAGGASLFVSGCVIGGVGLVALLVGVPMWAVSARRIDRLRSDWTAGWPVVWFDGRRREAALGWTVRF